MSSLDKNHSFPVNVETEEPTDLHPFQRQRSVLNDPSVLNIVNQEELSREHAEVQSTVHSMIEFAEIFQKKNQAAIELAWQGITVESTDGSKVLLSNASGKIKGKFLAIMGPSGSGKTTLMNTLACRCNNVRTDGVASINGVPYSTTELKQISGYVMQDDLLEEMLTVEETLYYTAQLRLPSTLTEAQKSQRIEEVLHQLGLTRVRHTIIGGSLRRGISGGERKRVCVAMELLTKPRLLFLDEPTSGLDSVTSLSLCKSLKEITQSGECTVICTIHQPQAKIFYLFDTLMLLKAGRIVYFGAIDRVLDFFSEAGYPCEPYNNPADHILDVITDPPSKFGSSDISECNKADRAEKRLLSLRRWETIEADHSEYYPKITFDSRLSWWHQFRILLGRSFRERIRNRGILFTLLIQNVLISVLIGTVFLQIGHSESSVQRRSSVLFFLVISQGVFAALSMINTFPSERLLVLRERASGSYQSSAYFVAKNLAEIIFTLINPIIFSVIVYFLVGLQPDASKFFIFVAIMILCAFSATSLALMVSTLCRTTSRSVTVLPMALEMARLFGGFFLPPNKLPSYFVWIDSINYVKYAYIALSLNEFTDLSFYCTESQLDNGKCKVTSGQQVLDTLGMNSYSIGLCVGVLLAFCVVTRAIAYVGLRFIKW